jgi:large subunit ribosomal protein L3
MPEKHKPRSGSLQYWPRKRARRIYPSVNSYPEVKEVKPLLFGAFKAGMTRILMVDTKKGSASQGQTVSVPVTVLDSPSVLVLGVRVYKEELDVLKSLFDVYAENLPKKIKFKSKKKMETLEKIKDEIKCLRLLVSSQPKKSGLSKKTPEVFEIELGGSLEDQIEYAKNNLGKEIKATDIFKEGDFVDVVGVTKGHGFTGVVKRFGVKIRGRKDEQKHRHIGVLSPEGRARVLYTAPQSGQHGFHRRTEYNKRILKIGEKPEEINPKGGFVNYGLIKGDYILLKGTVPGPKKRFLMLRPTIRTHEKPYPIEIKEIDLKSQQGV